MRKIGRGGSDGLFPIAEIRIWEESGKIVMCVALIERVVSLRAQDF